MTTSRVFLLLIAAIGRCAFAAEPSAAPAVAQTPSVHAPAALAQPLGRLFFTPEERATIDDLRRRPPAVAAAVPAQKALPPAPEYVTLNGVVRRSDGSTSVWLNNRMLEGKRTSEGLEVSDSKRSPGAANVTVKVPQAGRSVDLRVGQQLDVTSGKIQERYQLAPRVPAPSPGSEATATESTASKPSLSRRPSRDRELREMLRDIESSQPPRQDPAAEGKG